MCATRGFSRLCCSSVLMRGGSGARSSTGGLRGGGRCVVVGTKRRGGSGVDAAGRAVPRAGRVCFCARTPLCSDRVLASDHCHRLHTRNALSTTVRRRRLESRRRRKPLQGCVLDPLPHSTTYRTDRGPASMAA
jgi:hypothetical protein